MPINTAHAGDFRPTIRVTGEAALIVDPDTARFSVGVVRQGTDPALLQEQINADMSEVVSAVKASANAGGISGERLVLKTEAIRVYETWTPRSRAAERINEAFQNLSVEIKGLQSDDAAVIGAILAQAGRSGANRVDAPNFFIRDRAQHEAELRVAAAVDARNKALAYLSALGGQLGRVLLVEEESASRPGYLLRGAAVATMEADMHSAPPLEIGENEISLRVTVLWEIVDRKSE